MPSSEATQLRIYCICGQKMKVSEEMFGRPGKCVACRQKIRIPRVEELPDNSGKIYLKDHPEFLRKVKPRPLEDAELTPVAELQAAKNERKSTAPLDVLDHLRLLCNLDYKVQQQFDTLKEIKRNDGSDSATEAELQGLRARIRSAQADLEEDLRQRLMETAIELASAQEKLAELALSTRVGELPYEEYRTQADRLRRRRDLLERRQINLRGWLTVDDPHRAGGLMDVTFDQVPKTQVRVSFPPEPEEGPTLLDWHIEALRHALDRRAMAERKVSETDRMRAQGGMSKQGLADCRAEANAEKERAQSLAQFCRERLEQLANDYSSDLQAIDAQMAHVRGRLQSGQLTRERFDEAERKLVRAKTDLTKARGFVVRALSANTVAEVPRLRGTFIGRLAQGRARDGIGADSILGLCAAAGVAASIFLAVMGDTSPVEGIRALAGQASEAFALVAFPLFIAGVFILTAFIPLQSLRAVLFSCVWFGGGLIAAVYLHEAAFRTGAVAERLRDGGALLIRPGVLMYAAGMICGGVAAAIASLSRREVRVIFPIAFIALAATMAAELSDFGGLHMAKPVVQSRWEPGPGTPPAYYDTEVTLSNEGRRLLVLSQHSTMRNAYDLMVETRIGPDSWNDVGAPTSVQLMGQVPLRPHAELTEIPLRPGENAKFTYRLPVGDYRVLLVRSGQGEIVWSQPFEAPRTIGSEQPVEGSAAGTPPTEPTETDAPMEPVDQSAELLEAVAPRVNLRGIIAQPDKPAQFSINVTMPDGRSRQRTYSLGDEVLNGWTIREFNPDEQTVTLGNNGDVLILRRGDDHFLAPAGEE